MTRAAAFLLGFSLTLSFPSHVHAFEKVDIPWCDEMLARYEGCLQSVTYKQCEIIARRENRPRTYGKHGHVRTYATPAAACLAEVRDLNAEARFGVTVEKILSKNDRKKKEQWCVGFQRHVVTRNTRALCGK
jgi:hypothetical protein